MILALELPTLSVTSEVKWLLCEYGLLRRGANYFIYFINLRKNHQFLYHADNQLTDYVMSFLWGAAAPSAPVLSLCPCLWVEQQSRCKRADSVGCVVRLLIHKLGWIYPFCLMRLKCCDAEVVKEHTR